jgi:hypothetical protein
VKFFLIVVGILACGVSKALAAVPFPQLEKAYEKEVKPLLRQYCIDCHSTENRKGELDLEQMATLNVARRKPSIWIKVLEMLQQGEMPPKKKPQLPAEEKKQMMNWVRDYLDAEALANAGDPGQVVLRRLSNAEYTYTIQDLTGVLLTPAKEFPVDGAAGEGFMNVGDAMTMSPALVQKYLDAAKEVAAHAVLVPDGIRFSMGKSKQDWTDELLYEIRSIYSRHTSGQADTAKVHGWNQDTLLKLMKTDGKIKLDSYLEAVLRHRESLIKNPGNALVVARKEKLNAKYLRHFAKLLTDETPTQLLRQVRDALRTANPSDGARLAGDIRRWQEKLWKFEKVGQVGREGRSKSWMNPVTPVTDRQEFRLKLPIATTGEITVYLAAGDAGDGPEGDAVVWEQPRLEIAGQKAIPLQSINGLLAHMENLRKTETARTAEYLKVIAEAEIGGRPAQAMADERGLDTRVLGNWMNAVQFNRSGKPLAKGHFEKRISNVGGFADIRGWGVPSTPSLIANKSAETLRFGTLTIPGRSVNFHPSPEKEAIIYWQSPMTGKIRFKGFFADSDAVCGNGAAWRVELIDQVGQETIVHGVFDNGKRGDFESGQEYGVQTGDLLKIVVNARDRSHVCDTTEVAISITEQGGKQREWNLARDVVDRVQQGNPLSDSFGNAAVWHFCDSAESKPAKNTVPPGSSLARWQAAVSSRKTMPEILKHAKAAQEILTGNPHQAKAADKAFRSAFLDANGQMQWLGLSIMQSGMVNIETQAPSVLEFKLPADLAAGAEVVTTGALHPVKGKEGSAQFQVSLTHPDLNEGMTGQPIVAAKGKSGMKRIEEAYSDFRELFPVAMCHAQIVPVDEVVTMILFHREDEPLQRLMLSKSETAHLDRLWDELLFVSKEPFLRVVAHEQLYEFATQDRKSLLPALEALRESFRKNADTFRIRQKSLEPVHLEAVVELAGRAWRRPLAENEKEGLRNLYQALRDKELGHDQSIRLTLARVLTSPAFLYRLEKQAPATKARPWVPVSNIELANRLSYFLWSSMPDAELKNAMEASTPVNHSVVIIQAERMLNDDRTRRLAVEFACQWLGIRAFDKDDGKNEKLYPEFSKLRGAMYEESVRFIEEIFRNDGSILDLLEADHLILNEPLAKHYGIHGVNGTGWQRSKEARSNGRGGILGMATVLAKQSGASRTSPILRGNWVSETLLGERLPKPPANVPDLPDIIPEGLTARQLIEKHSSVPECARCHARIDPYGFALEQYDAIGRLRPGAVNTRTRLLDGKVIEGIDGLREYLLTDRRDDVVRQFCKKLLGYALGREMQLSDEPLMSEMNKRLEKNGYRFNVAVEAIITSQQFRSHRGTPTTIDN